MHPAFELVSFVTRAPNRVEALLALDGGPRTRTSLQEETGIPRATLSRILADFRERDLVDRRGYDFELTTLGRRLAADLRSLLDAVESGRALQTVAPWLPLDDLGVSLEELSGVEVTLPTHTDPMAPVKRAAAAVDGASHVRGFCYSVVHAPILVECRNVVDEGHRFEGVVAEGVLDVIASDPEMADRVRDLFESDNVEVSVHEGGIEPQLIIAGGTTAILATDDDGAIQGLVSFEDEAILAWAEETFESIKRASRPLDPDAVDDLLAT